MLHPLPLYLKRVLHPPLDKQICAVPEFVKMWCLFHWSRNDVLRDVNIYFCDMFRRLIKNY